MAPARPGHPDLWLPPKSCLPACLSIMGSWVRRAATSPSKESWEEEVEVNSDSPNLGLSSSQLRTTWGQENSLWPPSAQPRACPK